MYTVKTATSHQQTYIQTYYMYWASNLYAA